MGVGVLCGCAVPVHLMLDSDIGAMGHPGGNDINSDDTHVTARTLDGITDGHVSRNRHTTEFSEAMRMRTQRTAYGRVLMVTEPGLTRV